MRFCARDTHLVCVFVEFKFNDAGRDGERTSLHGLDRQFGDAGQERDVARSVGDPELYHDFAVREGQLLDERTELVNPKCARERDVSHRWPWVEVARTHSHPNLVGEDVDVRRELFCLCLTERLPRGVDNDNLLSTVGRDDGERVGAALKERGPEVPELVAGPGDVV